MYRLAGVSLRAVSGPVLSALAWLERLAGTRRGALALFVLAIGAHVFRSIAWPVSGGRDLDEYLLDYVQLLDRHPLLPWPMLFRTPATPIVAGLTLDIGHGALVEPVMAALYALSIVAWSAVARRFGRRAAVVTALALLLYQGYALMFHELSSEPFFAVAFMHNAVGWLIAPIIFFGGLAGIPIWRRMQREFLCTTAWARQQGLTPYQLKGTGGGARRWVIGIALGVQSERRNGFLRVLSHNRSNLSRRQGEAAATSLASTRRSYAAVRQRALKA